MDLSKRLSVAFGAGYSSVYADATLKYNQTVTFSDPAFPAAVTIQAQSKGAKWCPGVYTELRLNYRLAKHISVFLGGDFQYNSSLTFSDGDYQTKTDLGMTYAAKGGVICQF